MGGKQGRVGGVGCSYFWISTAVIHADSKLLNDLKVRHGGFPLLGATAEVSPVWYAWAFLGGEKLGTFFRNWGNDLHALFWTSLSEQSPPRNRQMANGWHCICCDRHWYATICHNKAIFNRTGSTVSVCSVYPSPLSRCSHSDVVFHTAFCAACISLLLRKRLVDGAV